MVIPAHFGLEHPNLTWLVVVGICAFVAGLGMNLYRSTDDGNTPHEPATTDDTRD